MTTRLHIGDHQTTVDVDVVNGRPAASEGLPTRATFAANLLILRELMHHAGRTSLTVVPAALPDPRP